MTTIKNLSPLDLRGASVFTDGSDVKVKFPDGTLLSFKELIAHINNLEARLVQVETCYMEDKLMGKQNED